MSVEAKVKSIVAKQLGLGEDEVNNESSFIDDLGADSLDTVELEKDYKPFIVNRGLSFNHDTALYANEMNFRHYADHKLQFDFFLNSIRPRKRYGKWLK